MKKRLLSILLVLLMALTLLPLGALADENSKCGESLTWNLDEIGILTISGTGDMYDYSEEPAPWSEYSDIITSITIDYRLWRYKHRHQCLYRLFKCSANQHSRQCRTYRPVCFFVLQGTAYR